MMSEMTSVTPNYVENKFHTSIYVKKVSRQMSCYFKCSVALPHGAMGWSAVCECGILFY